MIRIPRTTRTSRLLALSLSLLGLAATGCPETFAQTCPAGTTPLGGFLLDFALVDKGDTCVVLAALDGGPTDAGTVRVPPEQQATLCAGGLSDGGGVVTLAIAGQNPRTSPLVDGGFIFKSSAANVAGTLCACALNIDETIVGSLQAKSGGAVSFTPDGGLTPIGGLTANADDAVYASPPLPPDGGAGSGCVCNFPCGAHYTIAGRAQ